MCLYAWVLDHVIDKNFCCNGTFHFRMCLRSTFKGDGRRLHVCKYNVYIHVPDFLLIQNILYNSWGLIISDQRYIGKNAQVLSFFCTLLKVLLAAALNFA